MTEVLVAVTSGLASFSRRVCSLVPSFWPSSHRPVNRRLRIAGAQRTAFVGVLFTLRFRWSLLCSASRHGFGQVVLVVATGRSGGGVVVIALGLIVGPRRWGALGRGAGFTSRQASRRLCVCRRGPGAGWSPCLGPFLGSHAASAGGRRGLACWRRTR
jgi:hypothetical protein